MDKESSKTRTFVSTFRLEIKIPSRGLQAGRKKKEEEKDKGSRTSVGNNGVEATSATGRVQWEKREKLMSVNALFSFLKKTFIPQSENLQMKMKQTQKSEMKEAYKLKHLNWVRWVD